MLASGLNPNHEFEEHNKRNALHIAAALGHVTVVHVLLQARTQINAMDAEQNTPLTLAILARHNDIVKYLIKCGADLVLKVWVFFEEIVLYSKDMRRKIVRTSYFRARTA